MSNFECPDCGGGFPFPVSKDSSKFMIFGSGQVSYTVMSCPWCGSELSQTRTRSDSDE